MTHAVKIEIYKDESQRAKINGSEILALEKKTEVGSF